MVRVFFGNSAFWFDSRRFKIQLRPECVSNTRLPAPQDTMRGVLRRLWVGAPRAACFCGFRRPYRLQQMFGSDLGKKGIRRRNRNRIFRPNGNRRRRRLTRDSRAFVGARRSPEIGEAFSPDSRGGRGISSTDAKIRRRAAFRPNSYNGPIRQIGDGTHL